MVGTALKWLLIGYGADGNNPQYDIYNLVGNNIYPNIIPQNVGLPAISYSVPLPSVKYWNVMSMETLGRGKGIIIRCNLTDNNLG